MATQWLSACLRLTLIHYSLTLNFNQLKVPAQSDIVSGVFMIPSGGEYKFNASTARTACQFLNVTIATKGQLNQALKQGLQKCKFGWIDEEIVVIPRITANNFCGKNKTGVVEWTVDPFKLFAAFCFSSSGGPTIETLTETTPGEMFTSPVTPHNSAVSETQLPKLSPIASTVTPPAKSKPKNFVSTSLPATEFLPSHSNTFSHTRSFEASSTAIPTAFIILVVMLLLLAAAVAAWYNKKKEIHLPLSSRWKQKDDTETEIWRRTNSETSLQDQQREEDEELIPLNGSLMVLQEIKINFIDI